MSDIETRLAEGLTGVAERSPHPGDLEAGARERMRRRRRTTATVVAAALAVVAIPVGLAVVGPEDESPDRRETVLDPVPDDWRVETWGDLTLRVPPDWTWGTGTDWCTTDESAETATPVVSRPGRVARATFCAPTYGYGVHFIEPSGGDLPPGTEGAVQQYRGRRYPYGAWIGYASTGLAAVWVVTDSRELTRQVLDSTEVVASIDPNGCATQNVGWTAEPSHRMSVCRYDRTGRLEQSELLSQRESSEAADAVRSAPLASADAYSECGDPYVWLVGGGGDALLPFDCATFSSEEEFRQLTEEVMYWALSPGTEGATRTQ